MVDCFIIATIMSEKPQFTHESQIPGKPGKSHEPSASKREYVNPFKRTIEMLKKMGNAAFRIGTTSNKGEYSNLRARIIIKPMSTTPESITELKVAYRKKQEKKLAIQERK